MKTAKSFAMAGPFIMLLNIVYGFVIGNIGEVSSSLT